MAVSLVTGAGSGIGRATSRSLDARGDAVVCVDIDRDAAEDTAQQLHQSMAIGADVTDESAMRAVVQDAVRSFGTINNVVACAGVGGGQEILDLDLRHFRRVMEINVLGTLITTRVAVEHMASHGHGGSIVFLGSISSKIASTSRSAYAASKGGVLMLGKALAVELAPKRIRVNVVGPGPTITSMTELELSNPRVRMMWESRIPLQRVAEPSEVASVIVFLTGDESSYITGAFIPVDGGLLAQ